MSQCHRTGPGSVYGTGQCTGCVPGGVWAGGYTGWVIRGSPSTWKAEPQTAERAPEALAQGWSGWSEVQRPPVQPDHPLQAPQAFRGPLRCQASLPASWPIRARFRHIYCKVRQNREVSSEKCQKASHSPYFQNGLGNSPLDFLRFPFYPAFSGKELMGHF